MAVKHDNPNRAALHRWVQENLSAYIDGELPAPEKARLEGHLDGCAECAYDLETLRQTVALVRALPTQPVPRSFAIPESESRKERFALSWLLPYFRASAAAAAVFLIVTFCVDLFQFTSTVGQFAQAPAMAPDEEIALASAYPTTGYIDLTQTLASEMIKQEEIAVGTRDIPELKSSEPAGMAADETLTFGLAEDTVAQKGATAEDKAQLLADEAPLPTHLERTGIDREAEPETQMMLPSPIKPQGELSNAVPAAAPQEEDEVGRMESASKPMQAAPPPVPAAPESQPSTEDLFNDVETAAALPGASPILPTTASMVSRPSATILPTVVGETALVSPSLTSSINVTLLMRGSQGERDSATLQSTPRLVWRAIQAILLLVLVVSVASALLLRKH